MKCVCCKLHIFNGLNLIEAIKMSTQTCLWTKDVNEGLNLLIF